jgi:hypothetical protein
MPLNFADFQKYAKPREHQDIEVSELGTVRILKLNAQDRLALLLRFGKEDGQELSGDKKAEFCFALVANSVVDDSGAKVFDSAEGTEVLNSLDPEAIMAISEKALAMNNFAGDAKQDAKKN